MNQRLMLFMYILILGAATFCLVEFLGFKGLAGFLACYIAMKRGWIE